jgi:phosphoserine aminotransferase
MNYPKINFTPGPSQLYFTVEDHMKQAFRDGIPSLSHRSKKFESIYAEAVNGLRELLNLPSNYHIYFTGSATEIWERSVQNLVDQNSFHLVNGSFSKRFFEISAQLGKKATKFEVAAGEGFPQQIQIDATTELIAVTHNETSTGVSLPLEFIYDIKRNHPHALLIVDAVSSLPYPEFDYSKLDSVFFSVQKGFGLPAGLGVWMANEKCLAKAEQLLSLGRSIGSYHNLPSLHSHALKNQTPETPNVLAIYLLGKVVVDMLRHSAHKIRKETEYKSTLLYNTLKKHPTLKAFVKNESFQSRTVIVAESGERTEAVTKRLLELGMQPGDGYGAAKKSQLRFANFPTHAKEHFELLVDTLESM